MLKYLLLLSSISMAETHKIDMRAMKFTKTEIIIKAGDTVEWTNRDGMFHTVTSGVSPRPDKVFDSGWMKPKQVFSFTFKEKGEYNYFCRPHPVTMKGKVIVK